MATPYDILQTSRNSTGGLKMHRERLSYTEHSEPLRHGLIFIFLVSLYLGSRCGDPNRTLA